MLYNTIYLDMDGVVSDFYLELIRSHMRAGKRFPWLDHHGTPLQLHHLTLLERWPVGQSGGKVVCGDPMPEDWHSIFWKPMLIEPSTWNWIAKYPYANNLLKLLRQYSEEVVLCTHAHSEMPQEYEGKKLWCSNHGWCNLDLIIVAKKSRLAKSAPRTLLIDDFNQNVTNFQAAGGDALLFPRPWNKLHAHWRNCVEYVRDYLVAEAAKQNGHSTETSQLGSTTNA